MSDDGIIDFSSHLARKRKVEVLKALSFSDPIVGDGSLQLNPDVYIYLIDSSSQGVGVLRFGCSVASLQQDARSVAWRDFVLAWDVIADPSMFVDETHVRITVELLVSSLFAAWPDAASVDLSNVDGSCCHMLVIVDRSNYMSPLDVVVARSGLSFLDAASVHAIIASYVKEL
jgi:hypothetical protein